MAYVDTVGDIVRVTMAALYTGGQIEEMNVHYQCVISGGGDSRPGINTAVDGFVTTDLVPSMHNTNSYYGSRVSLVQTAGSRFGNTVTRVNVAGGSSDSSMPTQVRPLLRLKTLLVGRRQRGRLYGFTPITTLGTADGLPTVTLKGFYQTFGNNLVGGIVTGGSTWNMVIYHRPKPPAFPVATVTAVNTSEPANAFATQRRSSQFGRVNVAPW